MTAVKTLVKQIKSDGLTEAETPAPTGVEPAPTGHTARLLGLGGAAWAFSSLLLVYFHFGHTLVKPHYQYILLIPPVIVYLLWNRQLDRNLIVGNPSKLWLIALAIPLAILFAASWFFSPWLAGQRQVRVNSNTAATLGKRI